MNAPGNLKERKKISQNFLHPPPLLLPFSLPVLSAILFLRLFPTTPPPPKQTAPSTLAFYSTLPSLIHPYCATIGQMGNSNLTFTGQGMTPRLNVCSHDKKAQNTSPTPGTRRYLLPKWGLSTNCDATFPGIQPTGFLKIKKEAKCLFRWSCLAALFIFAGPSPC